MLYAHITHVLPYRSAVAAALASNRSSWDPVHEEAEVLEHLRLGRGLARGMPITLVEEGE